MSHGANCQDELQPNEPVIHRCIACEDDVWIYPEQPTFTTTQVNDLLEGLAQEVEVIDTRLPKDLQTIWVGLNDDQEELLRRLIHHFVNESADIIRRAMK